MHFTFRRGYGLNLQLFLGSVDHHVKSRVKAAFELFRLELEVLVQPVEIQPIVVGSLLLVRWLRIIICLERCSWCFFFI